MAAFANRCAAHVGFASGVLRTLEWHWVEFPTNRDRRIYIVARPATAKTRSRHRRNTDVKQIAYFGQKKGPHSPQRGGPFLHQLYVHD